MRVKLSGLPTRAAFDTLKQLDIHPLSPASWLPRIGFAALYLLSWLPYPALMGVGRSAGRLLERLAKRRARIADINLALCYPELDETRRHALRRAHFEAVGMGLVAVGMSWWWSDRRLLSIVEIRGREHAEAAFARGKGVIFYTGHFTTLELSGRLITEIGPVLPLYRPNENPVVDQIITKNRESGVERTIPRHDGRLMMKTLRANKGVWFAPDQNYGLKNSVFADFFGVPAATNTSTSRFAAMAGASVVPFLVEQCATGGYRMTIEPPLDDFPGDAPQADAQRLNDILEGWVRRVPAQYNWLHRRFKDRPGDEKRFY